MRNRLFVALMAATMFLHPSPSHAQTLAARAISRTHGGYLVVERILMNRGWLALSDRQVSDLIALADRFRRDPGHLALVGDDRVPGKSVPRFERIRPTSTDARRLTFRGLTREQRRIAATILDHPGRTDTAQR